MITFKNITLRRGSTTLLQDLQWTIYHKQRIGLIGANGVGKSSLFSLLLGELEEDRGDLELPKQIKIAHVAQETPAVRETALAFTLQGDEELSALQKDLTVAEEKNDGEKIAKIHVRLSEVDGYAAESRAAQLLDGLGFSHAEQLKSVNSFSGGWRVRLNLARALMCRSDILLLDEPTNHLDLDAVIWLEDWLKKYSGTLLLISHDREFLDNVVDHIAYVAHKQLKVYSGNYSAFEKQRAADLLLQQAMYEKQQKHVAHLQKFINRFQAGTRARQAQSRVKALARMELINVVQMDTPLGFSFFVPDKCPNPLISLQDVRIGYGDLLVLDHVRFSIAPEDRIALIGPNGAGKSSLIKLLAGELSSLEGTRTVSDKLKIGYFAQHQVDTLQLTDTPLQHLQKIDPQRKDQELRTYLGTFGFSGEKVLSAVNTFSGGEKSRLALALIIYQKPNLLLLDEPTNHLDLDMRHALSNALQDYQGAVVLVSHDRFLVSTTVDQLLLVANHEVKNFDGDIHEYEKWLLQFRRQKKPAVLSEKISQKSISEQEAQYRELRKPLLQKIARLEKEIANLEEQLAIIEKKLADQSLYGQENKDQLQELTTKEAAIKTRLQEAEQEWLATGSMLETYSR